MNSLKYILSFIFVFQIFHIGFGQIELENEIISSFIIDCFNGSPTDSILKKQIRRINHSNSLLIINESWSHKSKANIETISFYKRLKLANYDFNMICDFINKNNESIQIDSIKNYNGVIKYISNKEIDKIFKDGNWPNYHKHFGMTSLIRLSRPGINLEKNKAIIECSCSSGGTCGTGFYVIMGKANEKWIIIEIELVLIS
jgi:hypothetical protein